MLLMPQMAHYAPRDAQQQYKSINQQRLNHNASERGENLLPRCGVLCNKRQAVYKRYGKAYQQNSYLDADFERR